MTCLKLYQFERNTWWYLSIMEYVLESILEFVMKSAMKYVLKIFILKKYQKNHGLPKFASSPPLGGRPNINSGRPWNLIQSPLCRTPCRLFIHELFLGPLGLHLRVWSELGPSPPFRPMRALRLQWSWAFSLVCEMVLRTTSHTSQEPWPWKCESPKESVQRPSQDTSKVMECGHRPSSVMWSHMRLRPQPNAISMNVYSCGSSHMIK